GHPAGDLRRLGLDSPALAVDVQAFADPVEEELAADRLLEEVDRPGSHGARGGRHVAVAADHDDGELGAAGDQLLLEVDAAQPGHAEVDHEASRTADVLRFEDLLGADM